MFYDSFKKYCDNIGKTPTTVAKEIGFSANAPTAWKNKQSSPKFESIQKIADYFGITTDELLNGEPRPSKLHREEGRKIGVLASVGAGIPLEAISTFDQDDPDSWEEISKIDKGEYFALRIRGHSMEPLLKPGYIVIVKKQDEYNDMDFVIVLVNGDEGVCKQLEYMNNGGIRLLSLNPEFPPMCFTSEQIENLPVHIMGRCVEFRGKM